jgi:hypothetical protein
VTLSFLAAALLACATTPCLGQTATAQTATAQAASLPAAGTVAAPATATAANGNDAVTVDPAVMLAISGGKWASGGQHGSFRLLLLRASWDHVVPSRLMVQWLERQPGAKRVVVHSSRDADAIPAGWALGVPRLEQRNGVWYTVVTGATDAGRIRRTWRFALDAPGRLREVRP